MATRPAKCTNFGLCSKADSREVIQAVVGEQFECPECGKPLEAAGARAGGGGGPKWKILVPGLLLVALAAAGGFYVYHTCCASPPAAERSDQPPAKTEAAAALVRLHGSNTIGVRLAPALAEAFLKQKGASGVQTVPGKDDEFAVQGTLAGENVPVSIDIQAHGSQTGFADLGAGTADIAMSSRKITDKEATQFPGIAEKVIGLDALAVIVPRSSPAASFTRDEVGRIFSGETAGYNIYALDDRSGTAAMFTASFLAGRPFVSGAQRFEDTRALVAKVAADPKGIGFAGLALATGVKIVPIGEAGKPPELPDPATLATESYPYTRRLYFYVPANAKPVAHEFVEFALSEAGQKVADSVGVVGQNIKALPPQKLPPQAPPEYTGLAVTADRLNLDIRFKFNSRELDSKALDDLDRIAKTLSDPASKNRSILLFGFADSSGTRPANLALSKDRAAAVGEQLRKRGITPALLTGFGQDLPVAPNDTDDNRQKNRRVEVWLRR